MSEKNALHNVSVSGLPFIWWCHADTYQYSQCVSLLLCPNFYLHFNYTSSKRQWGWVISCSWNTTGSKLYSYINLSVPHGGGTHMLSTAEGHCGHPAATKEKINPPRKSLGLTWRPTTWRRKSWLGQACGIHRLHCKPPPTCMSYYVFPTSDQIAPIVGHLRNMQLR